jgi:hypothetical protein
MFLKKKKKPTILMSISLIVATVEMSLPTDHPGGRPYLHEGSDPLSIFLIDL